MRCHQRLFPAFLLFVAVSSCATMRGNSDAFAFDDDDSETDFDDNPIAASRPSPRPDPTEKLRAVRALIDRCHSNPEERSSPFSQCGSVKNELDTAGSDRTSDGVLSAAALDVAAEACRSGFPEVCTLIANTCFFGAESAEEQPKLQSSCTQSCTPKGSIDCSFRSIQWKDVNSSVADRWIRREFASIRARLAAGQRDAAREQLLSLMDARGDGLGFRRDSMNGWLMGLEPWPDIAPAVDAFWDELVEAPLTAGRGLEAAGHALALSWYAKGRENRTREVIRTAAGQHATRVEEAGRPRLSRIVHARIYALLLKMGSSKWEQQQAEQRGKSMLAAADPQPPVTIGYVTRDTRCARELPRSAPNPTFVVEVAFTSCDDSRVGITKKERLYESVEEPAVKEFRTTRVPTHFYNCGTSLREQCYENRVEEVTVKPATTRMVDKGIGDVAYTQRKVSVQASLRLQGMALDPHMVASTGEEEVRDDEPSHLRRLSPLPESIAGLIEAHARRLMEAGVSARARERELREEAAGRAALAGTAPLPELEAAYLSLKDRKDEVVPKLIEAYGVSAMFLEQVITRGDLEQAARGFGHTKPTPPASGRQ